MYNFKSILTWCLVVVAIAFAQPAVAQSGFGTGSNISQIYAVGPNGQFVPLEVDSNGALKSTAEITGDVNLDQTSLAVVDSDGDTWNIKPNGHGEVALVGESVNIATDTELQNLQDLVDEVEGFLGDTGVSRNWNLGSGTDSVASVQSGNWTVDRSWNLDSGSDTVDVVISSNSVGQVDSQGDNDNFALDYVESSPIHNSISPGNSTTISFSEPRFRVSVTPHNGEIRYSYTNSADTNSVPVAQNQRVDNTNLDVSQITIFVPYTESSAVDVTVEAFD